MYDIIVAVQVNTARGYNILGKYGIGCSGELPWPKIKEDMIRFREVTKGARIIMGRKTYEYIEKPLPDRTNVVVTKKKDFEAVEGVIIFNDLKTAINSKSSQKTIVIGGGQIYHQCFKDPELYRNLHKVYVTRIKFGQSLPCDTFFPASFFDKNSLNRDWNRFFHEKISNPDLSIIFETYEHINREEQKYLDLCKDIMENGVLVDTRPGIKAKSLFSCQLRFDVSNGVLPALTTKRVFIRGSLEEMLLFISGKTDTKILDNKGVKIWNDNTSRKFLDKNELHHYPEGDMGVTYSFQFRHAGAEDEYKGCDKDYTGKGVDQIANVIEALKSDEPNRRIMINLWAVPHINKMALPPCLFCYVFCKQNEYVSLQAIMRSADVFLGVPFNLTGTTFILRMVCHLAGRKPKEIVLDMVDTHIYENHFDQVREQLSRSVYPFPTLEIVRSPEEIGTIDGFKYEDFKISNYKCHSAIKAEMAV